MELIRPIGTRFCHTYFTSSSTNEHGNVGKIMHEYEVVGYEDVFKDGESTKKEICKVIGYSCECNGLKLAVKE